MTGGFSPKCGANAGGETCVPAPTGPTAPAGALPAIHTSAGLLDARGQLLHQVVHRAILANETRDLLRRVHDRRVVAVPELPPDLRKRRVGELAREVHRDLTRVRDRLGATGADKLLERDAESVRDGLLDLRDRHLERGVPLREDVLQDVLR